MPPKPSIWTPENIENLRKLAVDGYSSQHIAYNLTKALGIDLSPNAIRLQASRWNIRIKDPSQQMGDLSDPFGQPRWLAKLVERAEETRRPPVTPSEAIFCVTDSDKPEDIEEKERLTFEAYLKMWRKYLDTEILGRGLATKAECEAHYEQVPRWFTDYALVVIFDFSIQSPDPEEQLLGASSLLADITGSPVTPEEALDIMRLDAEVMATPPGEDGHGSSIDSSARATNYT